LLLNPLKCPSVSTPPPLGNDVPLIPCSSPQREKGESIFVFSSSLSRKDERWRSEKAPQDRTKGWHRFPLQRLAVLLALICSPPTSLAQTPTDPKASSNDEKAVISIGDQKITAREVNKILESMPPQYRPYYSGPGRRQLADLIVNNRLQAEEAEKRGLEKREDVKMKISIARESILTAAAREELEKEIKVSDETLQKFLDEQVAQYEEARVKRIVIRSKSSVPFDPAKPADSFPSDEEAHTKADEIHKKLLEGGDFEELAAKFSNDPMTSGRGGDMGFIRRGNQTQLIVPPLENEIFSIKVGTISDVMKTALGYEIIKVEERRVPKLSDIRKEIETAYRKQKGDEWLKERKSHCTIQIDDVFFKPTKASGTAGTVQQ
jgi:parvulin-like peptidyl-prolyl isomerase